MKRQDVKYPTRAMLLSAGLGRRMRPLTKDRPKPLIAVAGRALIDRALDRIEDAGIEEVVINLHYMGGMIREHLKGRTAPRVVFSDESDELLETGGGVARALPLLGPDPFIVANSDSIWIDAWSNSLHRLAENWNNEDMDALLLLHPTVAAAGYHHGGDFLMAPDGRLERRPERQLAPFVFTGVQMLHPRLFENCPAGAFSMNRLYDKAIAAGRLFGLRHGGDWLHVGTRDDLAEAEDFLKGA